jgi:hypothetical protein
LDVFTRSELKRPLLVPGEFGAITSRMQQTLSSICCATTRTFFLTP